MRLVSGSLPSRIGGQWPLQQGDTDVCLSAGPSLSTKRHMLCIFKINICFISTVKKSLSSRLYWADYTLCHVLNELTVLTDLK
jgi:hypothetical protein